MLLQVYETQNELDVMKTKEESLAREVSSLTPALDAHATESPPTPLSC